MELPEAQAAVLAATDEKHRPITEIADAEGLKVETATGAAFALEEEGLLTVAERTEQTATLTDEGRTYVSEGLPELRLSEAAREATEGEDDSVALGEVLGAAGLNGDAVDIALANFARKGYGEVESGAVHPDPDADPDADAEAQALAALDAGESADIAAATLDRLAERGLIERHEETVRLVSLTEQGQNALDAGIETTERVDALTPELLTTGEWEDVDFAPYNVAADAPEMQAGRTHPLRQMADRVKDVLVGMGFEEMQGPTVDADFWINDCLFMPQDHPARTHWDRFALETPEEIEDLPADLVERVETAHREGVGPDGEGYHSPWDEAFARKLALRGHTTSLTARHLAGEALGDLEPPQRFFSVEKAYRNDTLDATHLLEFFQIEGWVMAEELSVRDLFGTFTEFYEQFGITDLQFKPHYNPYTEPSFELFGRHPETDELIEIGNSGIFRQEMLDPLGVDCDVMAWGLALERLMMLATGAEDIRDVHGTLVDLEYLRTEEVLY
jgi:phenylalanyl-tRNA synthetase alpha chain